MKQILLSKNKTAIVCECHYPAVAQHKWSAHSAGYGYRNVKISKGVYKAELLHRFIMRPPAGMVVDHINGDRSDNRCENLRVCTQGENIKFGKGWRRELPKNVYKSYNGKRFLVALSEGKKKIHIGVFDTINEAESAATAARKEHYGC